MVVPLPCGTTYIILTEKHHARLLNLVGFISLSEWPKYDEAKTVDKSIEIPIQINGKLRSVITVDAESPKESILETARADERVSSAIDGKTVVKEIYVPGKLVNIVVK